MRTDVKVLSTPYHLWVLLHNGVELESLQKLLGELYNNPYEIWPNIIELQYSPSIAEFIEDHYVELAKQLAPIRKVCKISKRYQYIFYKD